MTARRFSESFIADVKARTDLAALVGRDVELKASGRAKWGLCPFHFERTASFKIEHGNFHCFGCGAHGDAVDYLIETHGMAFSDAVARLALDAGLTCEQPGLEGSPDARRDREA